MKRIRGTLKPMCFAQRDSSHVVCWYSVRARSICCTYSGMIPDGEWNRKILLTGIGVGVTVAVKRLWLGLYLGRKTYSKFSRSAIYLLTGQNEMALKFD